MREASYKPKSLIDLGLLNRSDLTKIEASGWRWLDLIYIWRWILNDCRQNSRLRSTDFLTHSKMREVDNIKVVSLLIRTNWRVGTTNLRSKYLGTFEVRIAYAKLLHSGHVKQDFLQNSGVTGMLSMSISAPKFQFLFTRTNVSNAILKELVVCNNLKKISNVVIYSNHIQISTLEAIYYRRTQPNCMSASLQTRKCSCIFPTERKNRTIN